MLQMMADLVGWTASLAGFLILYRMYSGDGVNGPFGAKKGSNLINSGMSSSVVLYISCSSVGRARRSLPHVRGFEPRY